MAKEKEQEERIALHDQIERDMGQAVKELDKLRTIARDIAEKL